MLAKSHRIVRPDDYRSTVRRGRRFATKHCLVYWRRNNDHRTVRFGFIVAKPVGIAVRRNLVRRRLKSIAASLLPLLAPGTDIVIRALPGSGEASWDSLNSEISTVLSEGVART